MKFNYKDFPILESLDKKNFGLIMIQPQDRWMIIDKGIKILEEWRDNCKLFTKNIWHISAPFYEAFILAKQKLFNSELIKNVDEQSGTILHGNFTYCFIIKNSNGIISIDANVFYNNYFICTIHSILDFDNNNVKYEGWFSDAYHYEEEKKIVFFTELIKEILTILNFIKYAEIQTKELFANSKVKKDAFHKYTNDTNSKITMLNSTWFTNLVKSESFTVRGHFRLQPYGVGMTQKRLQWISEFEKTGYTAPARKLAYAA